MGGASGLNATNDRFISIAEYSVESAGLIKHSATSPWTDVPRVTWSRVSKRLSPLLYKRDSTPGSITRVSACCPDDLAFRALQ